MTNSPTLKRVLTTDSTNSSALTQPADTTTEPSEGTSGYIRRGSGPIPGTHDLMKLVPVSRGADNSTFLIRVYGVHLTDEGVYTHLPMYEITGTMCAAVGLSGKNISELHRYCDDIDITTLYGTDGTNVQVFGQAAEGRGFALLDMMGALWAYCQFKIVSGATNMNALHGGL